MRPIVVLGAGSWGTALAIQFARGGGPTVLWGRAEDEPEKLARERVNTRYLPGAQFPPSLAIEPDLARRSPRATTSCWSCPRARCARCSPRSSRCSATRRASPGPARVSSSRPASSRTRSRARCWGRPSRSPCCPARPSRRRSGRACRPRSPSPPPTTTMPSSSRSGFPPGAFAPTRSPTSSASRSAARSRTCSRSRPAARTASATAPTRRVFLITRGLAELMRLGVALGAKRETLMGLAGLGDLVLTCTDDQSRNRRFGRALAAGKPVDAGDRRDRAGGRGLPRREGRALRRREARRGHADLQLRVRRPAPRRAARRMSSTSMLAREVTPEN